jgi:hypothetical protein
MRRNVEEIKGNKKGRIEGKMGGRKFEEELLCVTMKTYLIDFFSPGKKRR